MGMAIPAAILGGTGLLGGLYSARVAQENNDDQIDFAQWAQSNSQEFNAAMYDKAVKDQRDMYEKYQSPQAIAQSLRAAGLNPSAMNGSLQGGTIPSVPSTPHSSPVATPQFQNEGSAFAQSLQSIGSAFSSLASAELQDAQTNESRSLLNEKLNQLILQNNGQQLMNAKTEFDTYAAQQKLPYEINELINDCYLKYYQGKHSEALASLVEVQEKIANKEFDIKSEEAATIGMMLQKQLGLLDENIRLTQAKQNTEKSQQASNYASARNQYAQAKINEIEAEKNEKTKAAAIKALGQQLIRDNIIAQSEQKEFALKMARLQDVIDGREFDGSTRFLDTLLEYIKDKVSIFK